MEILAQASLNRFGVQSPGQLFRLDHQLIAAQ